MAKQTQQLDTVFEENFDTITETGLGGYVDFITKNGGTSAEQLNMSKKDADFANGVMNHPDFKEMLQKMMMDMDDVSLVTPDNFNSPETLVQTLRILYGSELKYVYIKEDDSWRKVDAILYRYRSNVKILIVSGFGANETIYQVCVPRNKPPGWTYEQVACKLLDIVKIPGSGATYVFSDGRKVTDEYMSYRIIGDIIEFLNDDSKN